MTLNVLVPPKMTLASKITGISGKPLSIQPATIKGSPRPELNWFKNGEILRNSEVIEVDEITGRLLFLTLSIDDSGMLS